MGPRIMKANRLWVKGYKNQNDSFLLLTHTKLKKNKDFHEINLFVKRKLKPTNKKVKKRGVRTAAVGETDIYIL